MDDRTCSIEGCTAQDYYARDLCRKHYTKLITRNPSATRHPRRPRGMPILEWLIIRSHDEPGPLDTPCRVWDGFRNRKGYGTMPYKEWHPGVHRVAWIERYGKIPDETPLVLHKCDNPPCFADGHIFLGTHQDNVADRVAKGRNAKMKGIGTRTHCKRGHEYTAESVWVSSKGKRDCRACAQITRTERQRKAREG